MNYLRDAKEIESKKFRIYIHNVGKVLQDLVYNKDGKVIYDDVYKANKKMSLRGIDEWEILYVVDKCKYYLHITVPQDSYLSEIGINIKGNECVVEMNAEQALDYLEFRVAKDVILEYFQDKLIWDRPHKISNSLFYVKDRKLYDINQSYCIKLHTDRYIRYGEQQSEYESLYVSKEGKFFLYLLCDSLRTVNSSLYFRNKEPGMNEKADILPMSEEEAIKWYLFRGGNIEEFYLNLEKSKFYLSKMD